MTTEPNPDSSASNRVFRSVGNWRYDIPALALLVLLALNLFYPVFFDDKAIFYRDFTFITYPFRYLLSQSLHDGIIPYWTPHVFGGMPFMAAFHTGVFYPPSALLLFEDTLTAVHFFYFFHFLILGWFLYLLGSLWGFSVTARVCSSATGMLSGFTVAATLTSNFFLALVWFPAALWFFEKFRREGRRVYFLGTVFVITTQTLAACPEISVMTVGLLFLHALWFMPDEDPKPEAARLTASLALAVAVALGLSALQLWPTAKLVGLSSRSGGLDFAMHSHWSLRPSMLTTLFISPDYREYMTSNQFLDRFPGFLHSLYMGLAAVLSLALGLVFFRGHRAVRFWLILFFVGIFFALGRFNPLYEIIYQGVPFLNLFRFPEKYFFLSAFALVFLTGYGVDEWIKATVHRTVRVLPLLAVYLMLAGCVAAAGLKESGPGLEISLGILALLSVSSILLYFKKLTRELFSGIVCLLVLADLSLKSVFLLPLIGADFYREKPLFMDQLQNAAGSYRLYSGKIQETPDFSLYPNGPSPLKRTLLAKEYLRPYSGMVWGVEHAGTNPGLALGLKDHFLWREIMLRAHPETRTRILERSNVRYWIDQDRITRYFTNGVPEILPDRMQALPGALPRAFLVPAMRVVPEGELLNLYFSETFDPLQEVLLNGPVEFQPSPQFSGQVRGISYRPNGVTIRTAQEGNGFLVLLDAWFPGWTVTVDGKEQPVLRANHFYRAVQLGPGEHTLEFEYFPEGFRAGLIVSALSAAFLLILMAFKPGHRWMLPQKTQ